ncbi:DUF4254 domain-containing protein [Nannocystis pusilla]|uniref:DUF4254 domain-containing protein n=1 Tax=Nannocystis pusilla TaxID=889268 RepID=UPI003B7CB572
MSHGGDSRQPRRQDLDRRAQAILHGPAGRARRRRRGHRAACARRLQILTTQRDDLVAELDQLAVEVLAGRRTLKVYRQFKMYNDPRYRTSAGAGPEAKP